MPAPDIKQVLLYPCHAALRLMGGLSRRAYAGAPSSWTMQMTAVLVLLPFVLLVLHLWDGEIVRAASASTDFLMRFLRMVTDVIRTAVWICIAALTWLATALMLSPALGAAGRLREGLMRLHAWATLLLASIPVAGIPVEIGKHVVGRARPPLINEVGPAFFQPFNGTFLYESFPSGHSMMAGIMMMSLWIFLPRWRVLTVPVCLLFCVSRLAAGLHYPTDVLAGLSIGFVACWWVARFMATRNIIFLVERGRAFPFL